MKEAPVFPAAGDDDPKKIQPADAGICGNSDYTRQIRRKVRVWFGLACDLLSFFSLCPCPSRFCVVVRYRVKPPQANAGGQLLHAVVTIPP